MASEKDKNSFRIGRADGVYTIVQCKPASLPLPPVSIVLPSTRIVVPKSISAPYG